MTSEPNNFNMPVAADMAGTEVPKSPEPPFVVTPASDYADHRTVRLEGVDRYIHFLEGNYAEWLRAFAAGQLGGHRGARVVNALTKVVENFCESPRVRVAAIRSLGLIGATGTLGLLLDVFENDEWCWVAAKAFSVIVQDFRIRNPAVQETFLRVAESDSFSRRDMAVRGLGELWKGTQDSTLVEKLIDIGSSNVMFEAVGKIGGELALIFLNDTLRYDPNPIVIAALGNLYDDWGRNVYALQGALRTFGVSESLIDAIIASREPRVVPSLIKEEKEGWVTRDVVAKVAAMLGVTRAVADGEEIDLTGWMTTDDLITLFLRLSSVVAEGGLGMVNADEYIEIYLKAWDAIENPGREETRTRRWGEPRRRVLCRQARLELLHSPSVVAPMLQALRLAVDPDNRKTAAEVLG